MKRPLADDASMERTISVLLRTGVVVSGSIVFAGGVYYLLRHGNELPDYKVFHGQPAVDRTIAGVCGGVRQLRARSIIQLGLLLLIATPIARVAVSLIGFALEKDRVYVVVTAIVLAVLLYSLLSGGSGG